MMLYKSNKDLCKNCDIAARPVACNAERVQPRFFIPFIELSIGGIVSCSDFLAIRQDGSYWIVNE